MKRNKTAVIGLGNYLMADEGVGLHALNLLEQKCRNLPVDLVEAGTCGMNLLHQFEERKKVIFLDGGNCNRKPGQFVRFHPDEVVSRKQLGRQSLHEFDLIEFLTLAKKLEKTEDVDIVIYCIQTQDIKMSDQLSQPVKNALPIVVDKIYNELAEDFTQLRQTQDDRGQQ